jgi:AcrR family transcriptional regulator
LYQLVAARRARVLRDQPTGEHPQALRRHLIAVTQRLLAAHGLTGLTTRGIAREAQVSDGVLYNHFADKDDLVVAAIVARMTELTGRATSACPRPGQQDLHAGLAKLVDLCLEVESGTLPLIGGLISRPDLVTEVIDRMHTAEGSPQRLWVAIIEYLTGEQQAGTISPDVAAETVTETIFGVTHLHVLTRMLVHGVEETQPITTAGWDRTRLIAFLHRACAPDLPAAP